MVTTGLTAESSSFVIDSTGRRLTGSVTIELLPGVGVGGPNGEHLDRENGPHTVPVAFAAPLLASKRARIVAPVAPSPDTPVQGAPEGVVQRDPLPESRESMRTRKR
jgi:hypothetical protein